MLTLYQYVIPITCLYIASKLVEETLEPFALELSSLFNTSNPTLNHSVQSRHIHKMERKILSTLSFTIPGTVSPQCILDELLSGSGLYAANKQGLVNLMKECDYYFTASLYSLPLRRFGEVAMAIAVLFIIIERRGESCIDFRTTCGMLDCSLERVLECREGIERIIVPPMRALD